MARGPRDPESVGDVLDVIDLLAEEPMPTARRLEPEAGDAARPPRRRRVLVLAIAAAVVAIAGVSVVASRDDGEAEGVGIAFESPDAEDGQGSTTSNARTHHVPDVVPGSTTVPPAERPPSTMPGDASTAAPLLPEGAPSTPHVGGLVASAWRPGDVAYYLYADGRLIWWSRQAGPAGGFVEQRLTPEGVERVRVEFLSSNLFDPAQQPGDVPYCMGQACVRGDHGSLLSTPQSAAGAERLVSYIATLDSSLPDTEWAAPRIRTYVASRIEVCLQTFVNIPDRVVGVPPDLSILVAAFPARAAELLGGREASDRERPCFEVTLEEARTLADEFLGQGGGGSHAYSGIVIRNPAFDAIRPDATEGIVAYVNFQALLPDGGPALMGG